MPASSMPMVNGFDRLRVVLVAPRNPLNIGAAARAMSNFGFPCLRVVNPYEVAFREARSAVGAAELLAHAEEYASLSAAVADCALVVGTTAVGHRELQHPLWTLQEAAPRIHAALGSDGKNQSRVALVFGSEKFGLSRENLSHCHWLLHIPTREENYSMNLGQAVAVCLYELARDGNPAPPQQNLPQMATSGELERLMVVLREILSTSKYAPSQPTENIEEQLRRLVLRLHLCSRDVEILLGMLRRILWKMESKTQ